MLLSFNPPARDGIRQRPRGRLLPCIAGLVLSFSLRAQIPATHKQGTSHGFLVVKSAEGKIIGVGDQIQIIRGNEVRSRLVLHFNDGSVDDEVSIFSQNSTFQLISDHHVQKGPSFPQPLDLTIDVARHKATWVETKDNKKQTKTEEMDLPPSLANGMISLAVQNFPAKATELALPYAAGTSKPRIVKLIVTPDGHEELNLHGFKRTSTRFNLHVDIGGVLGVAAKVTGKQPEDIKVWVYEGDAPTFLRMRGALYQGGPIWTTELSAPTWVQDNPSGRK